MRTAQLGRARGRSCSHRARAPLAVHAASAPSPLNARRKGSWNGSNGSTAPPKQQRDSPGPGVNAEATGDARDILQAFFYGRALARVLSRRLGEAVVDVVAEVSKAAAEQPQRLQELQEEIVAAARSDMGLPNNGAAAATATASGGRGAAASAPGQPQDLQAVVDDLRAEIAYSRAALSQLRAQQGTAAAAAMPPTGRR